MNSKTNKAFDYIIIGAGLSGSVIAERIASTLDKAVLIIEKREHIGGNCYDYKDDNGIIIHKYGPHLFHTDNKKVWDYLSAFTEWEYFILHVQAYIAGKTVTLPFNFNTIEQLFPKDIAKRFIEKLTTAYALNSKIPIIDLKKNKDKVLSFLSDYIYNNVFLNYTFKQWGLKPEEIDPEVTKRVPIFIGKDDRYFNDSYQGVPKLGYTKLFEKILKHPKIRLLLNTDFKEIIDIDISKKKIYFFGQEYTGKIIYTGMLDELLDYKFGTLPYRSLDLKFETIEKNYFQKVAVVNYPNNYDFTRITEFKHIHSYGCMTNDKTVILKEFPMPYEGTKNIPFYPMFDEKSKKEFSKYNETINNFKNIIPIGRLAEYKYYDMDDAVENALKIFEEKIKIN